MSDGLKAYDKLHKNIKDVAIVNFVEKTCFLWDAVSKNIRSTIARDFEDVEFIQCTGVHDDTQHETEIFNNDILEFEYKGEKYIARVENCQGSYALVSYELPDGYIVFPDIAENDRDYDWIPNSKVIGNRYTDLPLWLRLVV